MASPVVYDVGHHGIYGKVDFEGANDTMLWSHFDHIPGADELLHDLREFAGFL